MGLMNGISQGLSAAGYAGGDLYAKGALEDQRAAILRERDLRLEEMKNAPLNRISAAAKAKMAEEVPLEAAPVTAVSGTDDAGEKFGFKGDLQTVRKSIEALPEGEDKTAAMAQLQSQVATETKTGLINVQGKTRRRTADEALAAAVEDAKVNDLPAVAAYESQIGKPKRDERRIDNQETRQESQDATNNRRLDIQQKFNEDRAKIQDKLASIAEARASRAESRAGDQMDKAEMNSNRQALTSVLKDIATQEDKIQVKMLDPMLDEKQKNILEAQFKMLDRDRMQARSELLKMAGIEPTEQSPAEEPGIKYDAQGRAYVKGPDGNPVLQSEANAGKTASTKPAVEPAKPAYTPPADSPAGRAAATREKAAAGVAQKQAAELQSASDLVTQALASKDPQAAVRAQDAPGFSRLDAATKAKIFSLVNGR